ncbi:hypothetical protein B0H16DRAFT_1728704 [Mycena metata]|uniref:Uncharacterized protein n=1 Tax=Mycena metata TaxID=1033252 RepID=A0AAD7IFV1_9AGAR|nr:hypothetical protein B0H16DRAFT_1728704 [Mycena metata]
MANPSTALDLCRNRNPDAPLGPLDGRVGAVLTIGGEPYIITTNTDYVPIPPIRKNPKIVLRADLRYGDDDPTLWPQKYSAFYAHLGAIRRKPARGEHSSLACMWWDPEPADFVGPEGGRTLTRGLGLLRPSKLAALAKITEAFSKLYERVKVEEPAHDNVLLPPLIYHVTRALDRLRTVPTTFIQAAAMVTTLQRMFLEAEGLLTYMRRYKAKMGLSPSGTFATPEDCVGVFTTDAVVARQFAAACLPFWYIRPAWTFANENILAVVEPVDPASSLSLDGAPGAQQFSTTVDTDAKMAVIHSCAKVDSWYKDPFKAATEADELAAANATSTAEPIKNAESVAGPSTRFSPYSRTDDSQPVVPVASTVAAAAGPKHPPRRPAKKGGAGGRNKWAPLVREEMPPSIPTWADALAGVDTNRATHSKGFRYVFPEPALLVSSDSFERRQKLLNNFVMMQDALLYRLCDLECTHRPLSSQEWRDVLGGKVVQSESGGRGNGSRNGKTKAVTRALGLKEVLAPALRACGITEVAADLQTALASGSLITIHRAQEILWGIAETSFRYEFLALDARASGLDRADACRACFAGGMLVNIPVELSKEGLAALSLGTRHKYTLRMAKLMKDWLPAPQFANMVEEKVESSWTEDEMRALEKSVTVLYTQAFYDIFGRAAVLPCRLLHGFGT